MTPSSGDKGQVSSSFSKKTNHSHAGTRPPAQPEGVHLGVLDGRRTQGHKDWDGGLCIPLAVGALLGEVAAHRLSWGSSLREDRLPQPCTSPCWSARPVTLRLSSPAGLSSKPPPVPNELLPPHLSKTLQTLDCVASAAIPQVPDDSLWNHLSLIERDLCLCFTYLIG